MNNKTPRGHFVAALVWFGLTTAIAIVLLVAALVVWLSELTGSFIASALLIGGFFAVLSMVIYLLVIRDAMERFRTQLETIYEVARLAQTGYEWIVEKLLLFIRPREEQSK